MAAVRRGSESGVIVALVICLVAAIVGIGLAVWFYQQASLAKRAILTDQKAFRDTVGAAFTANSWELPTMAATELGVEYNEDTYGGVAEKLAQAAEYEKQTLPLLGWESLDVMRATLDGSPAQQAAAAQGLGAYATLKGLVGSYEKSYVNLNAEVARLRADNTAAQEQLQSTKDTMLQGEQQLRAELTRATEGFSSDIATLRQDYNDIVAQHTEQQQAAVEWQKKYQDEVNARGRDVDTLKRKVKQLEVALQEAVAGPGERKKMEPQGKVLVLRTEYEFVVIEGGQDRDMKQDVKLVVYGLTPDGQDRKKGVIQIGQVKEHTSLATVSYEAEPILVGDYFVSVARWAEFHGEVEG